MQTDPPSSAGRINRFFWGRESYAASARSQSVGKWERANIQLTFVTAMMNMPTVYSARRSDTAERRVKQVE
jgi:hypothetical protein